VSGADAIALLTTRSVGFATAMTWVPPAALRGLTWDSGVENEPEALQAVAASHRVDLAFAPADASWAPEALARLAQSGIAGGWIVAGVLGRVAKGLGWLQVIRDSASRPGELAFALDEALHRTLEEVRAGIEARAEVLMVADDLAGAAGWLVAPDFALEALMPCYHRILSEWACEGRASAFHSDGDVRALMGALRSIGFDGVHLASLGQEALLQSVTAARAVGLCPLGGIETRLLTGGGARRIGALAGALAGSHGLIVADDGGMTTAEQVAGFGLALDEARLAAGGGSS
jgi:hypothetical protein